MAHMRQGTRKVMRWRPVGGDWYTDFSKTMLALCNLTSQKGMLRNHQTGVSLPVADSFSHTGLQDRRNRRIRHGITTGENSGRKNHNIMAQSDSIQSLIILSLHIIHGQYGPSYFVSELDITARLAHQYQAIIGPSTQTHNWPITWH